MNQDILLTILGGGNLILFIKFLIERHDRKVERAEDKMEKTEDKDLESIKGTLVKLEKDGLRTQLLLMILLKGDEKKEILTLGQHYFDDLKGNWYMTDIFNKWLEEKGHSQPDWFKRD